MFAQFQGKPILQSSAAEQAHASEIIPGLWIGDAQASQDAEFMRRNNIQAILNCTKDLPVRFAVENMRIAVHDDLRTESVKRMCELLPHAGSFLYKNHVLDNRAVLVHCAAGIQRSATCAAYYLSTYYKMPMDQAVRLIVSKRPVAFFNGQHLNFGACLGM